MKDDDGKVLIKNFYADVTPLTETEKKAIAAIPQVDDLLKKELGFTSQEMTGTSITEAINLPSLNI
ncbi:hypothetical protein ABTM15_19345, partial [Acinetobacter baumannii]